MPRFDLYLKVQAELDPEEPPQRLAEELCRHLLKLYGVRSAELSSFVAQTEEG